MILAGCTSNNNETLTGKWMMYKVIQGGNDVTTEHNPHEERFLVIKGDSTFESGGRPYGKNTGKYEFNSMDHTLFLDSDTGPDDDSQWKVTIKGDTMYWQGYGSQWAEEFQLIHLKEKL